MTRVQDIYRNDRVILREERRPVGADWLHQIEVDVAVAHVAERHHARAGKEASTRETARPRASRVFIEANRG